MVSLYAVGQVTEAYQEARSAQRAARPRTPILIGLARMIARRAPRWARFRTTAVQIIAFACLDLAAWRFSELIGLVAIGVSLLILESLTGDER